MTHSFFRVSLGGLLAVLVLGIVPHNAHAQYVQIQSVSPAGALTPGTPVSFVAAASGFTDPSYSISDSFSGSGATTGTIDQVGFFTWTPGVYDAGRHSITVSVTDSQQHVATTTVTLIVTGNSVMLSSLTPGSVVTPGRTVTFSITAPGFMNPSYAVYDSLMAVSGLNVSGNGVFSWTPSGDDRGTHVLTIVASDAYGHNGQTQQTIVVADPSVSVQSLRPSNNVSAGTPISFSVATPLSATTTYSVSDTSSGGSTVSSSNLSSTGLFTWTPTAIDVGSHILTLSVTDGYGNTASTTLSLWVTSAPSPSVSSTPTVSFPTPPTPSTPPQGASTSAYVFTKNLVLGSKGVAVTALQKRLTTLGFYSGPLTGFLGPLTSSAVKNFQEAHGIAKVGVVGPLTRAALNQY